MLQKKGKVDVFLLLAVVVMAVLGVLLMDQSRQSFITGSAVVSPVQPPGSCSGTWTNCNYASVDDLNRATVNPSKTTGAGVWKNYNFDALIPVGSTINKVEIRADFFASLTNGYVDVQVSNNGGVSFGSKHRVGGKVSEQTYFIDVTTDLLWSPNGLSNANFQVKATCVKQGSGSSPKCNLDYLPVTVTYTEPVTCTPTTCGAAGAQCGTINDGCGGTLNCGTCPVGQNCNVNNQCVASCTPNTCAGLGAQCGNVSDGCGGTLNCGTCSAPATCNAANQCVSTPACSDGTDNDNDGLADFPNDPGCTSSSDTAETESTLICDNGADEVNDRDTLADYRLSGGDPGCISATDNSEIDGMCDDNVDDASDADSLADASDLGCSSTSDASEVDAQCDDLADNDGDGKIDYPLDSGCSGYSDNDETDAALQSLVIDRRIVVGTDDAEEGSTGIISRSSTDLEMMNDGTPQLAVGLRYQVNITKGANIQNAYIQFVADEVNSEATQLTIQAENVGNSQPFASVNNDLTSRPKTSALASWNQIPAWNTVDEAGPNQRTPDLKAVIQEVVNRADWQAGNSMSFIITGTGKRVARTFDAFNTPDKTPLLHVEFTPQCATNAQCSAGQECINNVCTTPATLKATPPNFKVAFIGDSGRGSGFQSVLNLIKNEGADMVIEPGDLGYGNNVSPQAPGEWEQNIISTLDNGYSSNGCTKFPFFISMGNHENGDVLFHWTQTQAANGYKGYREMLRERWSCHGITPMNGGNGNNDGTKSAFVFNNLLVALTAPGETCATDCGGTNADKAAFLDSTLLNADSLWKVAAWHRLRNQLQTGTYDESSSMDSMYENARIRGAIIATAHWHTYSRTHVINSMLSPIPAPVDTTNPLEIKPGQTIVFHNGLGGGSIRDQWRCAPTTSPYGCNGEWASIYSNNQSAAHGALFIEFNVDTNGDSITEPRMAHGYFKNVNGQVIDDFILENTVPGTVVN